MKRTSKSWETMRRAVGGPLPTDTSPTGGIFTTSGFFLFPFCFRHVAKSSWSAMVPVCKTHP